MARGVPYSIGVDLGGTNLRAAAISARGKLLEKVSGSTNLGTGREAVIGDIAAAIQGLESRHGAATLAGVGVAVPGFIRLKEGVVAGSHNLPQFNGFPMRDEISRRLGKPVILENDANAAALGEQWRGAGRGVDDLVLLTLGTGIGGGIISGGRVLHGYLGMAAELGHVTVAVNGNPCGCGNTGCLEKHASASALAAMAGLLRLGENLTAEQVFHIAKGKGDAAERARRAFEAMGSALGVALASLINIFNFPLYLLGGGALPAWRFFAPAMFAEVERRSFTFRNSETRIERARLGGEAGLYGAAALPFAGQGA